MGLGFDFESGVFEVQFLIVFYIILGLQFILSLRKRITEGLILPSLAVIYAYFLYKEFKFFFVYSQINFFYVIGICQFFPVVLLIEFFLTKLFRKYLMLKIKKRNLKWR